MQDTVDLGTLETGITQGAVAACLTQFQRQLQVRALATQVNDPAGAQLQRINHGSGSRHAPPPPAPSPAAVHMENLPPAPPAPDQVVTVIGMVTKKTGMFSSELYHLAITGKRLVFALQTKEMQNRDVAGAREEAKQQGKNFFGQIGAQMSTRSGEKYLGMSPDLILAENPQNFAIDLEDVLKISIYHGDFEDNSPDSMEIKTKSQKLKFNISNYYNVEKQLKAVLGSKVH